MTGSLFFGRPSWLGLTTFTVTKHLSAMCFVLEYTVKNIYIYIYIFIESPWACIFRVFFLHYYYMECIHLHLFSFIQYITEQGRITSHTFFCTACTVWWGSGRWTFMRGQGSHHKAVMRLGRLLFKHGAGGLKVTVSSGNFWPTSRNGTRTCDSNIRALTEQYLNGNLFLQCKLNSHQFLHRSWRYLMLATSVPTGLGFLLIWLVPESPR